MARFYGEIGFGDTVETEPGVWEDAIIERKFSGSVLRHTVQTQVSDKVNDDATLSNSISVVGNRYAFEHLANMRYIKFDGGFWTIDSAELKRPQIILSLGGVYNGPKAGTPSTA